MIARFLGFGDVTYAEWYLRHPWPRLVIAGIILVAIAYAAVLYHRHRTISKGRRIVLGTLRALLYTVLIVLLFEPVLGLETSVKLRRVFLVLLDRSESMNMRDARKNKEDLEDAALCMGKAPFDKRTTNLSAQDRAEIAQATRFDLTRGLIDLPDLDVFDRLGAEHKVRYYCFAEGLEPTTGEGEVLVESLRRVESTGKATRLGTAIAEAVSRYGGQPIAGALILTDGASNEGLEPIEVARTMKERGIPLYTIGFGVPDPPDLRVKSVIVQDTVFYKDIVPVRVQLTSKGYTNRTIDLALKVDGKTVAQKPVTLTGKAQFVELDFVPERDSGTLKLDIEAPVLPGEVTHSNNVETRRLRVIDEKIKVLYVEGKPRWEYRYLRAVLLRDHRLDVKFLMTQGDRDLAKASERYLSQFPDAASEAFVFDLVILGDVPATYFTPQQMARLEELVRERGGSLLVLAGHQHPLSNYLGTPIERLLPVRVRPDGWESVDDMVHPEITEQGLKSTVVLLEADEAENTRLWSSVRPLHQIPALEGKKPAATLLATLSDQRRRSEPYPLIAWQRYGSGKSLYVGTDQLWRLRYKVGDRYHARFWGQAIQFLTLSRLLGENKRVHIEADAKSYRTGDRVEIYTNVLNENYEPVLSPNYTVYLDHVEGTAETKPVRLEAVHGVPGLFQGYASPEEDGAYRLRADSSAADVANVAEFQVASVPLEEVEPAMQEALLRKMAELSGGEYLRVRDLPSLPEKLAVESLTTAKRMDRELWDLPYVFGALLACMALEWFLRRRYDLI
ncbi:VWA domain-containing protein [bacterium]|nr:VWA domain-containing protein [bacterium]